ncbi:MAG: SH3 domain-containing protein, partial [Clostridia bacterium]|nr:SH3 domain-containing protein [Clostridia bacterium]
QTPVTMYVYTEDGGTLNVRSTPMTAVKNVITKLSFGSAVTVIGYDIAHPDWVAIQHTRGIAWVMAKYLTGEQPARNAREQNQVNYQMSTYRAVADSYTIIARPVNNNGWVNFRSAPSTHAKQIGVLRLGKILTVIGETANWYQAVDPATGKIGYVSKAYAGMM